MKKIIFSIIIAYLFSPCSFAMQPANTHYIATEKIARNKVSIKKRSYSLMRFEFKNGKIYLLLNNNKYDIAKINIDTLHGHLFFGKYRRLSLDNSDNLYSLIECIVDHNPDQQKEIYHPILENFFGTIIGRNFYSPNYSKLFEQISKSPLLLNCALERSEKLAEHSYGNCPDPINSEIFSKADAEVLTIIETLKNDNTLTHLTVSCSNLSQALELSEVIKHNTSIIHLIFKYEGMFPGTLAQDLNNHKTLKVLDLSGNKMMGVFSIAKLLENNQTLTELILDGNEINDFGVDYLALALLENKILKKLSLKNNPIQGYGTENLAKFIKNNTTMVSLKLGPLNLKSDLERRAWIEALENNKTLEEFPDFLLEEKLENLIKRKKFIPTLWIASIVLEQVVPDDIKKLILVFMVQSELAKPSLELELLLAATKNDMKAISRLSSLYSNNNLLRKCESIKYKMLESETYPKPVPLAIYPELANYYYRNHEYALAFKYFKLLDESGDNRFKVEIEWLSAGLLGYPAK